MKIYGIILAAGKGTRINSKKSNKVTLPFMNKPLIIYSVELLDKIAARVIVVIGAFHESVKKVLKNYDVLYSIQKKRLGTGHAVKVGLQVIKKINKRPDIVLVGYGDHTMFYTKDTVLKLIELHKKEKPAMTIITTEYDDPDFLAWGRIIRNSQGLIVDSIEQKDATEKQRKIKEVNPNFNCFDYAFLIKNINKIKKSPVSGEYYITELIKIAIRLGEKVVGLKVPFSGVGIGINRFSELEESQRLYLSAKEKI